MKNYKRYFLLVVVAVLTLFSGGASTQIKSDLFKTNNIPIISAEFHFLITPYFADVWQLPVKARLQKWNEIETLFTVSAPEPEWHRMSSVYSWYSEDRRVRLMKWIKVFVRACSSSLKISNMHEALLDASTFKTAKCDTFGRSVNKAFIQYKYAVEKYIIIT